MVSQQIGAVNAGRGCMVAFLYSPRSENKIIVERRTSGAKARRIFKSLRPD
jgi:hypothetical protein